MTYEQALAYWYSHVNYEQRAPTAADLSLGRMRGLLADLGDPHRRLRVLHVAGSKGKGSVAAMLAAVLRRAGYRTGLFTSPHLSSLLERVQVDGRPIRPDELAVLMEQISRSPRGRAVPPTFFEVATAVGLLHFVRRRVDAAVVEVGLGGRLDSTNVCLPVLAVITSISHDHTRLLGDRLASIAREKAGIVKPGRPTVSGATADEARAVIEEVCRQRRAPLRQLGVDFAYRHRPGQVDGPRPEVEVTTRQRRWPPLQLGLLGEHQAANAAVVVACVEELRRQGWHLSDDAVARGLAEVEWPARMEVVGRRPLVVLDCAHNVASARALARTLLESFPPARRLLVFACSNDKDVPGMFTELAPHFAAAVLTRYLGSSRAVPPEQLATAWAAAGGTPAAVAATPAEALTAARQAAGLDDLVCVTGSVFLAGEMRPLLVGGVTS